MNAPPNDRTSYTWWYISFPPADARSRAVRAYYYVYYNSIVYMYL